MCIGCCQYIKIMASVTIRKKNYDSYRWCRTIERNKWKFSKRNEVIGNPSCKQQFCQVYILPRISCLVRFIQSNERSEDSYKGLAVFFSGKSLKMCIKVSNNYRCAFIHIDAFMMDLGIYTFFEFSLNSSAENDINSTLQIRTWKWRKKTFL